MLIEVTDEIREELTKNQIARLFTSRVAKHFTKNTTLSQDDFYKYLQESSDEMKEYFDKEKKNETKRKR